METERSVCSPDNHSRRYDILLCSIHDIMFEIEKEYKSFHFSESIFLLKSFCECCTLFNKREFFGREFWSGCFWDARGGGTSERRKGLSFEEEEEEEEGAK